MSKKAADARAQERVQEEIAIRVELAKEILEERDPHWIPVWMSLSALVRAWKGGTCDTAVGAIRHLATAIIVIDAITTGKLKPRVPVAINQTLHSSGHRVMLVVAHLHRPETAKHEEAIELLNEFTHKDPLQAGARATGRLVAWGFLGDSRAAS